MNEMTFEQIFAATLIELDEQLPIDLVIKLSNQGVLVDEFIASHTK